ncbi:hypothetical protein, partial [Enterobacter hormaechei]
IGGQPQVLRGDHVILSAGKEPKRDVADPLREGGKTLILIGGCYVAMEVVARRAIAQGTKLAVAKLGIAGRGFASRA